VPVDQGEQAQLPGVGEHEAILILRRPSLTSLNPE
jgi:hypothetical protein